MESLFRSMLIAPHNLLRIVGLREAGHHYSLQDMANDHRREALVVVLPSLHRAVCAPARMGSEVCVCK